jgi:hypothetical protein
MHVDEGYRLVRVTIQPAADDPSLSARRIHQLKEATTCDRRVHPTAFA